MKRSTNRNFFLCFKCLLSIYAQLFNVRNELAEFIKITDNQIAQLSETENNQEIEKEKYS